MATYTAKPHFTSKLPFGCNTIGRKGQVYNIIKEKGKTISISAIQHARQAFFGDGEPVV